MSTIKSEQFVEAVVVLLEELHIGPPDPKITWVTSNEPNSGFLGTLEGIPAALASRPPAPGMNTIAAHATHLRFALSLANRALRGEDSHANADWAGSWKTQVVDEHQWDRLREAIRREHAQVLAVIGHGAYHLAAIRQIARQLKA